MYIITNTPRLPLPEHMPGRPDKRVTFGTELEGIADVREAFRECRRPLTKDLATQHRVFAAYLRGQEFRASTELKPGWWHVKEEPTIEKFQMNLQPGALSPVELTSPVSWSENGLQSIEDMYEHLDSEGFYATDRSALHLHTSLGWKKENLDDPETLQQVANVHEAFVNNLPFFCELMADHMHRLDSCAKNKSIKQEGPFVSAERLIAAANPPEPGKPNKNYMLNLCPLETVGTTEYKLKEAEGYSSSTGYFRLMICFTYEAALNPDVKVEAVLDKYFRPKSLVRVHGTPERRYG